MNYSVFIYMREVNKKTYSNIISYIEKGIKVYYLTESYKEEFENHINEQQKDNLRRLLSNYLVSMSYDICLSMQHGDQLIYADGKLPISIREELQGEEFNLEQYDIEHLNEDYHVIIKAGAGTGKTKTMIDRSMYLRHNGYCDFKSIVMITFTNKAALQMKKKLGERLQAYYEHTRDYKYLDWLDELTYMRVQTIHAFAKDFIQEAGAKIHIDKKTRISTLKRKKEEVLEDLIDNYRVEHTDIYRRFKYIPQYKMLHAVMKIEQYFLTKGIDILENQERIKWGQDGEDFNHILSYLLINLESRIKTYKQDNSIMELSDLIINLERFTSKDVSDQDIKIRYMMIDEFQDTDAIQVKFVVWLIRMLKARVFIVGDIKQSIYRFRGADYTAFEQFEQELQKQIPNDHILKRTLKKNYRSKARLIEMWNTFFSNIAELDTLREETKYFNFEEDDLLEGFGETESTQQRIHYFCKEQDTVKDQVVEYIKRIVNKNNQSKLKKEVAVLVRSNNDLKDIVERLENKGIVCKTEISGGFYRHIAIKEFYMMVKALLYPKVYINQYAFIMSSYGNGIAYETVFNNYDSSSHYLRKLIEPREEYQKLHNYRERLLKEPFLLVLSDIIESFEPHIGYAKNKLKLRDRYSREDDIEKMSTLAVNYQMNLMHLFTILDGQFKGTDASILGVEQFLNRMILSDNTEDEKLLEDDGGVYDLVCMTVHKSKGLEFDEVILPKTNNPFLHRKQEVEVFVNITPQQEIEIGYKVILNEIDIINDLYRSNRDEENKEIIAEEIRLLYVALTRTKEHLHIYKDKVVSNSGQLKCWMELIERGGLECE